MIISHVISAPTLLPDGKQESVIVDYTDSNGLVTSIELISNLGTSTYEATAIAAYPKIDNNSKDSELQERIGFARSGNAAGVDKTVLDYWTQTDFDRALLVEFMSLRNNDLRLFHYSQTFWQNARTRAGNSNGQRAASLQMSLPDYTIILDAYNLAQGSSTMWNTVETSPDYSEPEIV